MVQVCPRCQHANPREAVFCHFDGALLRQDGAVAGGAFPREFVFPSGRRCRTFDEFVSGLYYEWEEARELLRDGTITGFLASLGRADLAKTAREAQAQDDLDVALTNFVAALPARQVQGPKLNLTPRRLVVGPIRIGEEQFVSLQVSNEGRGILQGKLSVSEGGLWLKIADGSDPRACPIHAPREQTVSLRIDTSALVVGQRYAGKLIVVSNGGIAEVPIRLELTARPFPRMPYQGAMTPRELARKMRDQPHPAVPLLASGEIARWFESNGWKYPIEGSSAPGLAAVQQFFEELGLARAPQITISRQEIVMTCQPPEVRHEQVVIRSSERKLVYARAESDSPWLKVTTPSVSGQVQAAMDFTIDSSLMPEDRLWEGKLKIVANAGQSFHVPVSVEIQGNKRNRFNAARSNGATFSSTSPTMTNAPSFTFDSRNNSAPASFSQVVMVGGIIGLLLRLLLMPVADLYARWPAATSTDNLPGTMAAWLQAPVADDQFLRIVTLSIWWLGPLLGASVVWRNGGRWTDLICGALAGSVAGIAAGATLGCVLVFGDAPARWVLGGLLADRALPRLAATPLWLATVLASWMGLGLLLGVLLGLCGRTGRAALAWLATPFVALARLVGMRGLAEELTLE